MSDTLEVIRAAERAAAAGRPAVLATIVQARGSTPRGAGSRMLIEPAVGTTGTIGGGCGEAQVIDVSAEVIRTGTPCLIRVDLTEDLLSWSPAVCGGVFDVLLEPITALHRQPPHDPSSSSAS
jgi:xanthine/CO dehydrogenase XdhC/CoxF family maturation factor